MTEQFEETMQKTARNINVGYLSALFDMAIECIAKIAVDERISGAIHKAINPTLDDMIGQLHSMKNNTMATIMFANDEKTKVVQSTRADIIRSLYCDEGEVSKEKDHIVNPNDNFGELSDDMKDTVDECFKKAGVGRF